VLDVSRSDVVVRIFDIHVLSCWFSMVFNVECSLLRFRYIPQSTMPPTAFEKREAKRSREEVCMSNIIILLSSFAVRDYGFHRFEPPRWDLATQLQASCLESRM
jgi:hypothetical protein